MVLKKIDHSVLPGIALAALIAGIALFLNAQYPPLSPVIVAIIVGLLINNVIGLPPICKQGADYCANTLLKMGIILLGIRLSFYEILNLGTMSFTIIIICIVLSLTLVISLSRKYNVPPKLATLIAIGTAICGNTAIVALSPVVKAKEEEVAFAVATITVFGLSAIIVYPLVGSLLDLSPIEFGTWAGTAINDTSQVVAAGFIYGESAGEVATVVKLIRNLFIAPVVFFFSYITAKAEVDTTGNNAGPRRINYFKIFPWFVLGFLLMALVRTAGILPESMADQISFAADFLLVMALGGIGMSIGIASMRGLGLKAFLTGLLAALTVGVTSLLLVLFIL